MSEEDYRDATHAFWDAVQGTWMHTDAGLAPEQVVSSQGFTLQRLMHALEVMDPTMDGGMDYPAALIDARDRVQAPCEVPAQLSVAELCFVLDRLFALEIEWMHGAALGQTLYTCVYYHRYVVHRTPASPHWSHAALTAFLLATAKCCALQYHELMRQHVLDGEDFCGDPGGLALPDGVAVADAAAQLDTAMSAVAASEEDGAHAIHTRLAMKKAWLLCLAALCTAAPDGTRAELQRERCARFWRMLEPDTDTTLPLQSPFLAQAPTTVQGLFDVTLSRTYSSHIPLRPLTPSDASTTWQRWRDVLCTDIPVALRIVASDDVLAWLGVLTHAALAFERHAMIPFVRSLAQTCISDGRTSASGMHDLEHVALAAIDSVAGVSMQDVLVRLEWVQQRYAGSLVATHTQRFIEKLSGLLVQLLSTLLMNRARQKRLFSKAFAAWADLADEARSIGTDVHDALMPHAFSQHTFEYVVHFFALVQQTHIIGAGLDLELYADTERGAQYFLLAETFRERVVNAHALLALPARAPETDAPLRRWAAECAAHAELCAAYTQLYLGLYGAADAAASPDSVEAAFLRRIKWLRRPAWSPPASLYITQPDAEPHPLEP
ncbi:N-alpha-acetyltransferase, non-catalitic subunit [Malassezia brasiliensis]|uniref:N-alpha-acetyltransferase, non-catalitic subunit n=1 Tax=Malassezia brasiliensis TaxID=1821822 RepID=A0AAF0DP76_9BASI|nr:N-alpha-acetyltransferase, non-catalitic subunit [Malassezia brasiliensis]